MVAENPFWDFSVGVYGHTGVAEACLRLQDRLGFDVNLLMYCCWVARDLGAKIDSAAMDRIEIVAAPWRDSVVAPLREIRKAMKSASHTGFDPEEQERLRSEIKRVELRSEHLQQNALYAAADTMVPDHGVAEDRRQAAQGNIEQYVRSLGCQLDDAARADIETLVSAAFTSAA